jgi:5-methylcytosine-specific restriction endonuclease McrA
MSGRQRDPNLSTAARTRACAEVRRTHPWICTVCHLPIPRDVDHQTSRLAHTVDEIIPRSLGGSATDPANLGPAHRLCNSMRGNGPITPDLTHRCRTAVLALTTQRTSRRW